jgi:hypothetical protein
MSTSRLRRSGVPLSGRILNRRDKLKGDPIMKTCMRAVLAFALFLQTFVAFAGVSGSDGQARIPVSEPETLALLALGAVAVIAVRWSRRK